MELCVLNPEEANIKRLVEAIGNGKSQEWFEKAACWSIIPCESVFLGGFVFIFIRLLMAGCFPVNTLNIRNTQSQVFTAEETNHYATSFCHQFLYLLRRKIQIELRDPVTNISISLAIVRDRLKSIFLAKSRSSWRIHWLQSVCETWAYM